ncbi:hypothetical protein VitviT2T_023309 [Vitis vinifera]|uniref:VASt domain-containing protein n=2 Tax=Vitis vinifera TaxID=29760 RepID=A0ABY9DCD1_VITVI|eukprot:XP_002271102.1 PREDICTED: protein VASCULAR ASSOCIATED DEATH 1, chloroplastic isoform X1 [Vitis vinifera]
MEVASETVEKVESSRSMEHSPSKSSLDSASEASDQPDRTDPSNASPNPLKDVDFLQSPAALKSEEYRQLFRLPLEEVLVQDFNCALQESILFQGHMYLFVRYICFYSNIFGFETKRIIPFQEVTCVKRAKTAGIFPNAIEILAGEKKYFFASFLSRDEAFKLINDGWLRHSDGVKAISEQQESLSDGCLDNGIVADEEVKSSEEPVNELDSIDRNKDPPLSKDSKLPSDAKDDIVPITPADQQDNVEQNVESVPITDSSSSGNILTWKQENSVAPKVPEYYSNVAEAKFPIKVEEFFTFFFSDDAVDFIESFHKRCGDKEFRCTSWSPHDKFGHARDKSFQHPIKLYFGAKFGSCREAQKFRVYKNSHLIIETSQEVNDVPYGDYFTVEGLWNVESDGDESNGGCILRVYVNVAFSKKTMWKGKIVQSTVEECREAYAIWISLAHELLKQKNLEKQEEIRSTRTAENSRAHLERQVEMEETSERSHEAANSSKIPHMCDSRDVNHGNLLQGNTVTSFSSLLSEWMVKFSTLKNQRHLQLLFLITFVLILLLMQLSIVVLLARPQRVQVISQADYMNGMDISGSGERSSEAVAWLEKRIHHLKDEMFMVEARIERMRREYVQLKAQLKDLEHLRQLKKTI